MERPTHKHAIAELVSDFAIYSDRAQFDRVAGCFTEDGEAHWIDRVARGRAEIEASLRQDTASDRLAFVRHNLTTTQIRLDPSEAAATGRIYFLTLTNAGVDHGGVYVDRYARVDERWLIARREVRIDWQSSQSVYRPSVTRGART